MPPRGPLFSIVTAPFSLSTETAIWGNIFGVQGVAINGVDENLVKDLEQGLVNKRCSSFETFLFVLFSKPIGLVGFIHRTDIGVWSLEDVFNVGELLNALHTFLVLLLLKSLT